MEDSKQNIIQKIPEFIEFREAGDGKWWYVGRQKRLKLTTNILSEESIDKLDEPALEELMASLWANLMWPNISVKMKMILDNNEISDIRDGLELLIYGSDSFPRRYDEFRNSVSHIGTAAITELLAFVDPDEYCPWNEKTRTALRILDLSKVFSKSSMKYSQISGEDYEKCLKSLAELSDILNENGMENADLLDLHYFLAFIVENHLESEAESHAGVDYSSFDDFDHDEVGELIASIGENLGFSAEQRRKIAKGSQLDVYWSAKVGNMGEIAYAFEVQKSGSIDSLIINLQRARNDPKVQRIVVVSTESGLQSIRDEIETLQGDFRRYLAYLDVRDVIRAAQMLRDVNEILQGLRLSASLSELGV